MADAKAIKSAIEALASQFNMKVLGDDKKEGSADTTPGADTPATDKDPELKDLFEPLYLEFERLFNQLYAHQFIPFVHRWSELLEAMKSEKDPITKYRVKTLHNLLKEELKDTIKALEDFITQGVTTQGGVPTAMSFVRAPIGWSGTAFGKGSETISIHAFAGTQAIPSLAAFLLLLHPEEHKIREILIKRGEKYEQLGIALTWDKKGQRMPLAVSGKIVIDIESFNRHNLMQSESVSGSLSDEDGECKLNPSNEVDSPNGDNYTTTTTSPKVGLTAIGHLICKSTVAGYSLKLKKWHFVSEIVWNDDAFSKLVLPEDTKDILMSFVESQVENKNSFDDVIAGKGKGIIILLSGPPGVGKTLTAESVAESIHIPLYMISASDLGTYSGEVEESLQEILEMIAK
ncbi:hypothetical protein G7Y89_g12896 [Cudoniella acicularis]|uniref:ATPase AAA-type core domain-containing protein n=1 Tax=Cudoniella acicularis TaxID=354080 RepID=A0A8H4VYR2_9HELO|nr:hypothetical protein G7Y89_g12896 [Cudoniella acicularis]